MGIDLKTASRSIYYVLMHGCGQFFAPKARLSTGKKAVTDHGSLPSIGIDGYVDFAKESSEPGLSSRMNMIEAKGGMIHIRGIGVATTHGRKVPRSSLVSIH